MISSNFTAIKEHWFGTAVLKPYLTLPSSTMLCTRAIRCLISSFSEESEAGLWKAYKYWLVLIIPVGSEYHCCILWSRDRIGYFLFCFFFPAKKYFSYFSRTDRMSYRRLLSDRNSHFITLFTCKHLTFNNYICCGHKTYQRNSVWFVLLNE